MQKCKSCGERYDPNFTLDVPEPDTKLENDIENGEKCGDCIFDQYFERQSMKEWEEENIDDDE